MYVKSIVLFSFVFYQIQFSVDYAGLRINHLATYVLDLLNTVEPVYNGHLGTRYIWPLYTGGCYRENLYKVVSSILVAMAVINE